MGNRWDVIPADTFMDILRRVPPSPRRRLCLVCRAKVLAFAESHHTRALVIADLTEEGTGGGRDLKLQTMDDYWAWDTSLVGACNGLLCLYRHNNSNLVVFNPFTGEKIAVPPPSNSPRPSWELNPTIPYSFAYHPATGLYKIVRVRCHGDGGAFGAVDVFTLGDRSWREVPVPAGTSCSLRFGLVSTGGATYWVATDAHSLMSFDLKDERVASVTKLPVRVGLWQDLISRHLITDVSGRLGLAVCSHWTRRTTRTQKRIQTKVWMLEDRRRSNKQKWKWVLQYKIVWPGQEPVQEIAWPLATDGELLLATRARWDGDSASLLAHRISETRSHGGVVRAERTPPLIVQYENCYSFRTFAHFETMEPLASYRCHRR